jgi:hypothetical protein
MHGIGLWHRNSPCSRSAEFHLAEHEPFIWPTIRDYVTLLERIFLLERVGHQIAGVEVKAAATVTVADFRGLRKLQDATGSQFAAGVVLYDGETSAGFGERLFAVPIRTLWEMS